jgi:DNA-binding FrmR family transcriptional regulator
MTSTADSDDALLLEQVQVLSNDLMPTSHDVPGDHSRGYTADKEVYLKRLRRIEGQIRGLQRMVSEDAYCIDVLTQVSAATKALQSVALGLLEEHLGHCVGHAADHGEAAMEAKVKEASDAIARLVRS